MPIIQCPCCHTALTLVGSGSTMKIKRIVPTKGQPEILVEDAPKAEPPAPEPLAEKKNRVKDLLGDLWDPYWRLAGVFRDKNPSPMKSAEVYVALVREGGISPEIIQSRAERYSAGVTDRTYHKFMTGWLSNQYLIPQGGDDGLNPPAPHERISARDRSF